MNAPTNRQKLTIRVMIACGLLAMAYFLYRVYRPDNMGDPVLYWLLVAVLTYASLKSAHEWIHYLNISVPERPEKTREYTVDVFTTFCPGEPYDMMVETLTAIKNISYPHESYLCDEADDPFLKSLCEDLGIHHVTRTEKINAKAGNINNALAQSNGEICLVLDPDHVPEPDFLDHVIPHFQQEDIGFVQVVQTYKNEKESLIARGAAQQTYQFYGPIMMTMSSYGTAQAIGANCTFRREALESIGGHAAGLAEDMHTSMKLHAKGWKSVYVPQIVAKGLVPSTLSAYYKQQLKWSRGVFELLFRELPGVFRKLSLAQKLHYAILPAFYLGGIAYLLNFLIPILAIFLNRMPFQIDLIEFILIGSPLFLSKVLIRQYSQRWLMEEKERGFHIVGGLLLIGTWWIHSLGFLFTIIKVKIKYNPTPKDGNEANNWPLNIPNLIVILLSLIAGIVAMTKSGDNSLILMMASLAFLNCFILSFTVIASRQQQYQAWIRSHEWSLQAYRRLYDLRKTVWAFNHQNLKLIRVASTGILIIGSGISLQLLREQESYRLPIINNYLSMAASNERAAGPESPELSSASGFSFAGRAAIFSTGQNLQHYSILIPAKVLFPGNEVTYSTMTLKEESWNLVKEEEDVSIRWKLKIVPKPGEPLREGTIGYGPKVTFEAPSKFDAYRVVMEIDQGASRQRMEARLRHPLDR